eukprot:11637664-Ditylum_brightwellii.AAC.1
MEDSIEVKESKLNGDGDVWASSHSRVKLVRSKEHAHVHGRQYRSKGEQFKWNFSILECGKDLSNSSMIGALLTMAAVE